MENIKTAYTMIQDILDDADGVYKVPDEKALVASMEDGLPRRIDVTTHSLDAKDSWGASHRIEIDTKVDWGEYKKETLENGDVILRIDLSVKVSTNGYVSEEDITDYLRGMVQLNTAAKQIRKYLEGKTFYQVIQTAEGAKKAAEKKEMRRIDNDVKDAINVSRKNMRVGTIRRLTSAVTPAVPNDTYLRQIDGKTYQLDRKSKFNCHIVRVA